MNETRATKNSDANSRGNAPTVGEVLALLDEIAPFAFAAEWDNCGLLVGDPGARVKKILVALDPVPGVLQEAEELGAELIITHHPLFLTPLKSIREDSPAGRAAAFLIRGGISLISAHTNFDLATGGVADLLTRKLGFEPGEVLEPDAKGRIHRGRPVGWGRVVSVEPRASLQELISRVSRALGLDGVRATGHGHGKIGRLAVVPGSGADLIDRAATAGCDAILTGDVKYHQARRAQDLGLAVLDIGHFASEAAAMEGLARSVHEILKDAGFAVDIILSEKETEPMNVTVGLL